MIFVLIIAAAFVIFAITAAVSAAVAGGIRRRGEAARMRKSLAEFRSLPPDEQDRRLRSLE